MTSKGKKKGRALGYIRVSGRGQIEGSGLDRQRQAIKAYAKRHGYELEAIYADEGVSGTLQEECRPGLGELIGHLEGNGVTTVIVEAADRLARHVLTGEIILERFRELGVRVLTADGDDLTESDDPGRVLVRQVYLAIAQFNKSILVGRLKAGRAKKRRETGSCEGAKAFGTLPSEKGTLERIGALRREKGGRRMSYRKIAAVLNEEGRGTRRGGPWTGEAVRQIVIRSFPSRAE